MMLLVILLVLGIVVAGAIYTSYHSGRQKPLISPPTGEQTGTEKPTGFEGQKTIEPPRIMQVNFSQAGNLLNREGWMLLYEEPGNPAIDVNLKFTNDSLCDLGKGELPCDPGEFEHGSRVNIEGNKSGKEVMVARLKKL